MHPAYLILSALLFAAISALSAAEPAKPVNPNTWIKASTDHPDAQYKVGEKAAFLVSLTADAPDKPTELEWKLTLDGAKLLKQGTLTLVDGKAAVEGTLEHPGILRFQVSSTKYVAMLGIGMAGAAFDPYNIAPTAELPNDFKEFWDAQTSGLSRIPLDAKVTFIDQPNAGIELYEVSFANIDGRRSHGYLAKPKGATSLPIMISQPGMGVHPNGLQESRWVINNAALGFLALDMSAHDMPMERTAEDEAKWQKFVGYPYIGSDDRMTYYYRHVFTGMVRGIDYMTSRPDWNHKAVISSGGSQGGRSRAHCSRARFAHHRGGEHRACARRAHRPAPRTSGCGAEQPHHGARQEDTGPQDHRRDRLLRHG